MRTNRNSPSIQDADLRLEGALPATASTTVTLAYLDLGALAPPNSGSRDGLGELDCYFDGLPPAVAPDTTTYTLSIEAADDTTFMAPRLLATATFTADDGVGIAESHVRAFLPSDCPQFIRFLAKSGVGTQDASVFTFAGALHSPIMPR